MEQLLLDETVRDPLRGNFLLGELRADERATLLRNAEVRAYAPEEMIFRQGEEAAWFFLVLSGIVRLYRTSSAGAEKVVDLVQPGSLFAEAVYFMNGRYPVHAAAQDRVRVIAFQFSDFIGCLRANSDLAFRMMTTMSRRIHALVSEIDQLTLSTACQRLGCYLLDLVPDKQASMAEVRLTVPKLVLASRLGIQPETLSRLLSKLRDEAQVEVRAETLILHDVERLRKMVREGL